MRCRHFFSFVLVLFLSFFFGSFITTNDSFAVADLSVTTSSWSSNDPVFPDCDSSCLSQYSYFIISSTKGNLSNIFFTYAPNQYLNTIFPFYNGSNNTSSFVVIQDFNYSSFTFRHSLNSTVPFTFILSETLSFGGSTPFGNLDITSNGTYDVTNYAQATVNVPSEVIQGDYHNDLVNINQSIIVCGAILLVLYFFYCIYRLIIKNSGVH